MKTEFYPDMPNDIYHSSEGMSKSKLDMSAIDPQRVEWANKCPQDEAKLKTLDFGDAMHAVCLEPHRLKSDFVVMPDINLRTNSGKAEKAEFLADNAGKSILTFDEKRKLDLMFESVMAHPEARMLIEADGIAEGSWFWTDDNTDLLCKCRPDKLIENLLVDVKTTPDLKKFHYAVDDYRYYVQDPWYCDGLIDCGVDGANMKFLVIQKTIELGRYPVIVVHLPQEAIDYGRATYQRDLDNYKRFLDSGADPIELPMSYRFIERAMDATTDILL